MMSIKDNIAKLKKDIPSNVKILAATKTRTVDEIKEAIEAGIVFFGENYVQEAEEKYSKINRENIQLHFIGHLQKNKINRALKTFDVINIDSFEIAKAIDKKASNKVKVTIEINISQEEQKKGCKPEELVGLVSEISKLENVEVIGLMAMTPYFDDAEKTRPYFKKMKELFDKVKSDELNVLSLGMTNDYKVAIEEGSNMVRIGSLIFN